MTRNRPARPIRLLVSAAVALAVTASACGTSTPSDHAADADLDASTASPTATSLSSDPDANPSSTTTTSAAGSAGRDGQGQVLVLDGAGGWDGAVPDLPQPPPVPLDEGGADGDDPVPNTDDDFEVQLNPAIKPGGDNAMLAPGAPGCLVQCISKAWVSSVPGTADVDLEVITTTPAKVQVTVGTSHPVIVGQQWAISNPVVVDGNDALATTWNTRLGALDPSTKYHILVRAEDSSGARAYRLGSFTTTSGGPAGGFTNDPSAGGCGTQCITKAWVTQVPGSSDLDIEVRTSHNAVLEVFASTAAPTYTQLPNGKVMPSFPGQAPKATTHNIPSTTMDARLTGLDSDAFHTILVYATDTDGRRSFRIGQVRTGIDTVDVEVAFHEIQLEHMPREQIQFWFDVRADAVYPAQPLSTNSLETGTGTIKLGGPGGSFRYLVRGASGEYIPSIAVVGYARNDGGMWKCAPVVGPSDQITGYILDDCDTTWSTADSGIGGRYADLPNCSAFLGAAAEPGTRCVKLTTGQNMPGNGYPRFSVIASFKILD
jgi:hypothetical protein